MGARTVSSDEEDQIEAQEDEQVEDNEAPVHENDEDDEDDDEEGQDEYEKDGFIVDDVEEEEEEEEAPESSDEELKSKKRKKKKRDAEENYELDEDDYELLQEANVTGFHRPKSTSKTKFKRLKKAGKISGEDGLEHQTGFSDGEDMEEHNRHGRTAEEKLERTLFGDDEGAPPEDIGEGEQEEEEEEIGYDDEMADFIVDEDIDENGQRVRRRKAKKRGPRQAAGVSSMALQEAQDIFGDVTELLDRRKLSTPAELHDEGDEDLDDEGGGYPVGSSRKKRLEEEFEPSVLKEKYMTDKDNHIRERDVPERLQLIEEVIGVIPMKESNLREADWIYEQAFGYMAERKHEDFLYLGNMDKSEIVKQINFVLTQLHDQKFEIPFIGMYRKEGCLDLLYDTDKPLRSLNNFKVLWKIFSMDKKWWLLKRRKDVLQKAYEKRAKLDGRKDVMRYELLRSLIGALQEAQSELAVDDVDAKYSLHFPADEMESDTKFKRPRRRSFYNICRKAGMNLVAKHFGLTSEQFGENLQAMYKRHEVEDSSSTPEDIAADFHAREFQDIQSILRGARHMAAVEISAEPAVRDYVRNMFAEKAVVNTRPTKEGNSVIDCYHRYATVKCLFDKPVGEFNSGQWLLVQKANQEQLVDVTVGLPKAVISDILMQEFETQYLSEGVSRTAQLWNEQRRQILEEAVTSMLLPLMEKEIRMLLTNRAKQFVLWEYGAELWRRVSMAPFSLPKGDDEDHMDEDNAPRILACCAGLVTMPTVFVVLDSAGEIVNTLYAPYIGSSRKVPEIVERKQRDIDRLLKLIIEYKPHVVVVGASSLFSKDIKRDIHEAIFKLIEQYPREMPDNVGDTINVYYGDEAVPCIYEASQVSLEQLPGQTGMIRRAVALGRIMQNPLAVFSSLCGPNREILSFKLHPLESFLTDDEKYEVIEQVLVTVTNQVGVDINSAAAHEWMFAPLQFVAGLGARKASIMQRFIQGVGRISTRKELLTSLRLMKKNVFMNACGFLRIRASGQAASGNQIMDPLDDTRIHPESYDLAKKLAETLYRHENDEEVDEEMLEMALEHVRENPNLIMNLDIEEYARIIQEREGIWKLETLKDIQSELLHGYQDLRNHFVPMGQNEEFSLLTGEDEETLCEGKLVSAKVIAVRKGIHCKLENGLDGFISAEDFSDEPNVEIAQRISSGNIITCRVKMMKKDRYAVDLTCKSSDLQRDDWQRIEMEEQFFRLDLANLLTEQEKAKKEEDKQKSFKPRMIVHPQFQNVSITDAIEALAEKDVGEIIIRPSSKGPTHLSITLKFFDGVYTHIDIIEGGKDSKDFASFLSLGKTLKVGDDIFEDLDEVIARYVDPLVTNLKEMLRYRKFRRGNKEEVDAFLRKEKFANPGRIVYCFSVSFEHPGAFMLSYLKNLNVHHEYVSLNPKGYRFRKRTFEDIDKLVRHFQKHVNDPVDNLPSMKSLAAMVPMKSPAPVHTGAREIGGSESQSVATVGAGWDNDPWEGGNEKGWASTPMKTCADNDWVTQVSGRDNTDGWNDGSGDAGNGLGKSSGTGDFGRSDKNDGWNETTAAAADGWGKANGKASFGRSVDKDGWNDSTTGEIGWEKGTGRGGFGKPDNNGGWNDTSSFGGDVWENANGRKGFGKSDNNDGWNDGGVGGDELGKANGRGAFGRSDNSDGWNNSDDVGEDIWLKASGSRVFGRSDNWQVGGRGRGGRRGGGRDGWRDHFGGKRGGGRGGGRDGFESRRGSFAGRFEGRGRQGGRGHNDFFHGGRRGGQGRTGFYRGRGWRNEGDQEGGGWGQKQERKHDGEWGARDASSMMKEVDGVSSKANVDDDGWGQDVGWGQQTSGQEDRADADAWDAPKDTGKGNDGHNDGWVKPAMSTQGKKVQGAADDGWEQAGDDGWRTPIDDEAGMGWD